MEYEQLFVLSFMNRTLELIEKYDGERDATLLINCLLGLLIVPKEELFDNIPSVPFESLKTWGIDPKSIKICRCDYGHKHKPDLRQLVKKLRNAVAHFNIEPKHEKGAVVGFSFRDRENFHAEISIGEIKTFVTNLAKHLQKQDKRNNGDEPVAS